MKKIIAKKIQSTNDALISREVMMRDFRVQLTKLVNEVEDEYSMTEKQAVELLLNIFKKHKTGEFIAKHIDKPSRKSKE